MIDTRPLTVFSDGLRLVGEMTGAEDAPLVMLLHGGGQTRHAWSGSVARLIDEGYAVGRYDARGHGDSDWSPTGDYALPTHTRDLIAVLNSIGRPAALVGASMGGVSSLLATATAAHLISALVLVDIVPRFSKQGVERVRAFMQAHPQGFADTAEAAKAVQEYNPNRAPSKNPDNLMRSLRKGDDGRLRWHWDPAVVGAPPGPELESMLTSRLSALPPKLPLLLVSGAQSDVVDDHAATEFRRQAPQAEIVVVDRAGHMVAGDRNDAFGDAISGFLNRVVRARSKQQERRQTSASTSADRSSTSRCAGFRRSLRCISGA